MTQMTYIYWICKEKMDIIDKSYNKKGWSLYPPLHIYIKKVYICKGR